MLGVEGVRGGGVKLGCSGCWMLDLLNIGGALGGRFEEGDPERRAELLPGARLDLALEGEVRLVAHEEAVDALARVPVGGVGWGRGGKTEVRLEGVHMVEGP